MAFDNVDLGKAAARISNEDFTFYSEGSLAGSTEVDFMNFGNAKTIRAERLKTLLANKIVDFLKLDIEGAEAQVLPDIQDELQNVQSLFLIITALLAALKRSESCYRSYRRRDFVT